MGRAATEEAMIVEILDRSRRIETRVTKFMEANGFDTKVQRAVWHDGQVIIPTPATLVKEIMTCIPRNWDGEVGIPIRCNDECLFTIYMR
jgi:hypothetical protein